MITLEDFEKSRPVDPVALDEARAEVNQEIADYKQNVRNIMEDVLARKIVSLEQLDILQGEIDDARHATLYGH